MSNVYNNDVYWHSDNFLNRLGDITLTYMYLKMKTLVGNYHWLDFMCHASIQLVQDCIFHLSHRAVSMFEKHIWKYVRWMDFINRCHIVGLPVENLLSWLCMYIWVISALFTSTVGMLDVFIIKARTTCASTNHCRSSPARTS